MRIYIASAFNNRAQVQDMAAVLYQRGHIITSSWHVAAPVASRAAEHKIDEPMKMRIARQCLDEIDAADCVLAIGHPEMRGALYECGYAAGRRKPIFWAGSRDVSLFSSLALTWPEGL
jgi:nucleoside 2-deoxyribosyltransferase